MFASNTSQVSSDATYIEDVFSTYLYTGNGSTQTITNGIDLAGKGGLVWIKRRNAVANHALFDTARGATKKLYSDLTNAEYTDAYSLTSFNADGFSVGLDGSVNNGSGTYGSWTFRKQPKFFDVVTYTGDGVTTGRQISHSLGSTPGVMIVKSYGDAGLWVVYHRSLGNTQYLQLSATDAATAASTAWNNTDPNSTTFTVGSYLNGSGKTYIAYLFAHNAGGFGLTGTDNVISCGSYTGNASSTGPVINLGYEPQWLLVKAAGNNGNWLLFDSMRGFSMTNNAYLRPNLSNSESNDPLLIPLATGFQPVVGSGFNVNDSGITYIYIAIRRGPMKTPTSGTSVFNVQTSSGAAGTQITTAFPIDLVYALVRTAGEHDMLDRLRGISNTSAGSPTLDTTSTDPEASKNVIYNADQNVGYKIGSYFGSISNVFYNFRRAPGFFDVVCWKGDDTAPRNINHNLTVVPEMMIVKRRSGVGTWVVYHKDLPSALYYLSLNATDAQSTGTNVWRSTAPTATVFTVGSDSWVNTSSDTYVNYLFASCPGVSKVGSYSGTGATQTISCGFAARFVLIKRTDSTGNWWVWDTARGMVAGTDPRLAPNSTAAETNANWVYTDAAGFQIVTTDATVNASGGSYIYLAIA